MSQYPVSNESKTSDHDASLPSLTVAANLAALGVDEDAALVRCCQRGDRNAFRLLVERHDKRVYALVARVLGPSASADDVDDVAQDVLVQAWRALPKFRADARFSTWLYRIATNRAIKAWHRRKKNSQTVSEEDLPEKQRTVILLHYFEEQTCEDIAQILS